MQYSQPEKSIIEQALQIMESKLSREDTLFNSPTDVIDYLRLRFADCDGREEFHVLYLDNKHRLIRAETESRGTIDRASVYPREIAKNALLSNASAVILAHNHPAGDPTPSEADLSITARIKSGLELFNIRTLDHIIIGDTSYSFAQKGDI